MQMPRQRLVAAGPGLLQHLPSVGGQTMWVWVSVCFALGSSLGSSTRFPALPPLLPIKTGSTHPSQGVELQFCPQTPATGVSTSLAPYLLCWTYVLNLPILHPHPTPLCFNKLDLRSGQHPIVQGVWQLGDRPTQDIKGIGNQAGCE